MNAFLQSDRIILRPFQKDDLPILLSYFNDAEIRGIIGEVFPSNEHSMELYLSKCQQTNDRISFVIAMKKTHEIVGEAGLLRIFYPWRTADCSIIIFNKTYWNKEIGSEVANLLFDYAFNYLGLHRLSIGVAGINTRALAFWKKAGFIVEGKQTDGYFYKGKFSDFIMMYQLDHHFNSLKNQ